MEVPITSVAAPAPQPAARHVAAFDGIRALAALAVVMFHIHGAPTRLFRFLISGGWYGCDVFFVLSGFLITRLLVDELGRHGSIDFPRFYWRRVLRLYPALISAVVLSLALLKARGQSLPASQIVYIITYTQNFWAIATFGVTLTGGVLLMQVWSLCIEEHFYLAWPLALRKMGRQRALAALYWLVGAAVILRVVIYVWLAPPSPGGWSRNPVNSTAEAFLYFCTLTRIDGIGIGCILGLLSEHLSKMPRLYSSTALWLFVAVSVPMLVFGTHLNWWYYTVGSPLMALNVGAIIAAIHLGTQNAFVRGLSWRPLVQIGKVSYGVYLLQFLPSSLVTLLVAHRYLPPHFYRVQWIVLPSMTVALAFAHYRYVEKYFLSLRERRSQSPVC